MYFRSASLNVMDWGYLQNTSFEFLQRVPDSTESIFKIGSTLPAALLYDALDHFDRRSAKVEVTYYV